MGGEEVKWRTHQTTERGRRNPRDNNATRWALLGLPTTRSPSAPLLSSVCTSAPHTQHSANTVAHENNCRCASPSCDRSQRCTALHCARSTARAASSQRPQQTDRDPTAADRHAATLPLRDRPAVRHTRTRRQTIAHNAGLVADAALRCSLLLCAASLCVRVCQFSRDGEAAAARPLRRLDGRGPRARARAPPRATRRIGILSALATRRLRRRHRPRAGHQRARPVTRLRLGVCVGLWRRSRSWRDRRRERRHWSDGRPRRAQLAHAVAAAAQSFPSATGIRTVGFDALQQHRGWIGHEQ
jgi:hypothetical protein